MEPHRTQNYEPTSLVYLKEFLQLSLGLSIEYALHMQIHSHTGLMISLFSYYISSCQIFEGFNINGF